jgi:hypothetical protein
MKIIQIKPILERKYRFISEALYRNILFTNDLIKEEIEGFLCFILLMVQI